MGDCRDVDWTLRQDWEEEYRRREVRNDLMREQLLADKTVGTRE